MATSDVGVVDDVVRRAQHGDVEAFESLYRSHSAAIYALCRRMVTTDGEALRSRARHLRARLGTADDVPRTELAGNLAPSTRRQCRARAAPILEARLAAVDRWRRQHVWLPLSEDQLDTRIDLDTALVQLPAGARAVFVLHDIEGYSHDEIAQMTGIAPGTARAQLWRARRALMRLLDL